MKRLITFLAIFVIMAAPKDAEPANGFGQVGVMGGPGVSVNNDLATFDGTSGWLLKDSGIPASSITPVSFGTFGSSPNSSGGSVSSNVITLQPASSSQPGGVTTGAQTFAGAKTFTGTLLPAGSGTYAMDFSGATNQLIKFSNIDGTTIFGQTGNELDFASIPSLSLHLKFNNFSDVDFSTSGTVYMGNGISANGDTFTTPILNLGGFQVRTSTSQDSFLAGPNAGTVGMLYDVMIGLNAGYGVGSSASNSIFIGGGTGYDAQYASGSIFMGPSTGSSASNASNSIFLGGNAGNSAANAQQAIFIGYQAGFSDTVNNLGAGSSIVFGNYSDTGGYSDSIAIGTGTRNSATGQLNLGRVLYATGLNTAQNPDSSPIAGGRVGVGVPAPSVELEVAGTTKTTVLNVGTILGSTSGLNSILPNDRWLVRGDGTTTSLDWDGSVLYSFGSERLLEWGGSGISAAHYFFDENNGFRLTGDGGGLFGVIELYDDASRLSVDGDGRVLIQSNAQPVLDWGGTNAAGADYWFDASKTNQLQGDGGGLTGVNPAVIMTNDNGTSVTFNAGRSDETIYDDSATLAANLTINLPSATRVGEIVRYVSARVVTTVTVNGTVTVGSAVTSFAANASVAWQAVDTSGTFIRIQ